METATKPAGSSNSDASFKWIDFILHVGAAYLGVLGTISALTQWRDVLDVRVQLPALIAAVNAAAAFRRSPRLADPEAAQPVEVVNPPSDPVPTTQEERESPESLSQTLREISAAAAARSFSQTAARRDEAGASSSSSRDAGEIVY